MFTELNSGKHNYEFAPVGAKHAFYQPSELGQKRNTLILGAPFPKTRMWRFPRRKRMG